MITKVEIFLDMLFLKYKLRELSRIGREHDFEDYNITAWSSL